MESPRYRNINARPKFPEKLEKDMLALRATIAGLHPGGTLAGLLSALITLHTESKE